ncbi:CRP/FNR family transcriptional regulator [Rhodobium orientis]|uniref:Crp/Fnr family transcriptional regulator n=1 Tax=Rhodobium orientis TaxID=34017 RepID=A0A327JHP6_9HYPH|nr:Crp/Fnr family transcriptional regulator [Rhodobium orientis]MBB4305370.1 CRP/FNR family transcriptional regulator [Rhodobium orientis]MBK5950096.1 hypothetical protein [Rhodobium orientis]RAI25236.1 hypothetical protein CH339_19000 [Rhodobium orientis]
MGEDAMRFVERMSEKGRALLAERLVRKSFARGSRVIDRGDAVSGAYFVLDGALRVFTVGATGKQATLYRIEPGETCVLALNALFNDVLYPAFVEAAAETTIGVVPGSTYRMLFASEAPIQDLTVRALSSAVFGIMNELERHTTQTVAQRLAGYLLLKAAADGTVCNTQQELAAEIGTTREVIGRLMAQFAEQGLVKTGRGRIMLVDRRRLGAGPGSGCDAI